MKIIVSLSIIIWLLACQKASLTEIKLNRSNGKLAQQYMVDQYSLIQGELITYYEDGVRVFEKAQYRDSLLHGSRELYFITGQIEIKEIYDTGVLVDTVVVYYPSGKIKKKSAYDKGVLSGIVIRYYENGQEFERVQFEKNRENGPFKEFHPNGALRWDGQYLDGNKEFGELSQYDSSGVLIKKMYCDSVGVCRTTWSITQQ